MTVQPVMVCPSAAKSETLLANDEASVPRLMLEAKVLKGATMPVNSGKLVPRIAAMFWSGAKGDNPYPTGLMTVEGAFNANSVEPIDGNKLSAPAIIPEVVVFHEAVNSGKLPPKIAGMFWSGAKGDNPYPARLMTVEGAFNTNSVEKPAEPRTEPTEPEEYTLSAVMTPEVVVFHEAVNSGELPPRIAGMFWSGTKGDNPYPAGLMTVEGAFNANSVEKPAEPRTEPEEYTLSTVMTPDAVTLNGNSNPEVKSDTLREVVKELSTQALITV